MFMVEQFTDDYTLNVTKEGYMFLSFKQAIQFLKTVDEDKVAEEGYLKSMIVAKRQQICQRQQSQNLNHLTMVRPISSDMSFNILSNPIN